MFCSVILEGKSERLSHAAQVLRFALAQESPTQDVEPLRLHDTGDAVKILLSTPADVDAVRTLSVVLDYSPGHSTGATWAARELEPAAYEGGTQCFLATLTDGETTVRVRIPHLLEYRSTEETPMMALPRLQPGEITFERTWLTLSLAHTIVAARQCASSRRGPEAGDGGRGGDSAELGCLLKLLKPLLSKAESAHAHVSAPTDTPATSPRPAPKPWLNPRARAASSANAATFAPLPKPAGAEPERDGPPRTPPSTAAEAIEFLEALGARVISPSLVGLSGGGDRRVGWVALAGGEQIQRQVEEAILFPMRHPDAFEAVLRRTRADTGGAASNRRTALLFYGPPGTGKTTAASITARESGLVLVYAPLEALISKWYGQGEQQLAALFTACEPLGASILFLDEIDALATSRDKEMHEASRRMLSVLLRRMDGLDSAAQTSLIAASNRPQDLDPALLSRFDVRVAFPLPDRQARAQILGRYARQLQPIEREHLAAAAEGLSGRDILDVCRGVERQWVSMLLRRQATDGSSWRPETPPPLPPAERYAEAVHVRVQGVDARLL